MRQMWHAARKQSVILGGGPPRRGARLILARRTTCADDVAARRLVRTEWIDALVDACKGDGIGGLLAMPVADTLKRAEGDRAVATLAREDVWLAQTPQMFRFGVLADALARSPEATDEASAIEAIGLRPKLVRGSAENFKVTHADDFAIAEALLVRRAAT